MNKLKQGLRYQIAGWILFILCAMFFLASSLKNQDTLAIIGSVVFLVACVVFLIPLVGSSERSDTDKDAE